MRNLLYQVCPFETNDEWLANLEMLFRFWSVFTGKKVISIKTGEKLVASDLVQERFPKDGTIEFLLIENDAELHERAGFLELLKTVEKTDGITFYAHTKGVSPIDSKEDLEPIRRWRETMYTYNLFDPLRIDAILETYVCCGCFKKYGSHHLSTGAEWHFSGTFFWFKNSRLFSHPDWQTLENDRFAVEGYLSNFFAATDAFCLFGDNPPADIYHYKQEHWAHLYRQELVPKVPAEKMQRLLRVIGDLYQQLGREEDARKMYKLASGS